MTTFISHDIFLCDDTYVASFTMQCLSVQLFCPSAVVAKFFSEAVIYLNPVIFLFVFEQCGSQPAVWDYYRLVCVCVRHTHLDDGRD